ncbi:MAG: hypothetical protein ABW275_09960 [Hansschlegelia sp.]|jgi:ElaB/YqjD/DUF883 family membrane-anchored ribosome-binding protein
MSDTVPGGSTGPEASALDADIEILKGDVARLTDTVSTLLSDSAAAARAAAQQGVDRATAAAESARDYAEQKADDLSAAVEQNPLTSVLIALGLGYIIGVLGRSRR